VHEVDSEVILRLNVIDGRPAISPPRLVMGIDALVRPRFYHDIYRDHLTAGRFLTAEDVGTNHCVISAPIARERHKQVGDALLLNQFESQIVGIYETHSLLADVNVLLDLRTVRKFMRFADDSVCAFYVEPLEAADKQALKRKIEDLFRGRQIDEAGLDLARLVPDAPGLQAMAPIVKSLVESAQPAAQDSSAPAGDVAQRSAVEVRLADDWAERFAEFTGDLDLFLALITAVGMAVAVLSIINTMLMSVTERLAEFGVLRANGWSQGNVVQLMLLESGMLGLSGGVIGVGLGWGASQIANRVWPERLQLYASPGLLAFGILFSVALGIAGGAYPAWLAARRSPLEALRRG
jgi:putative ABC transport system permease protein